MYETDYIMRMIQIMTRAIGETIFQKQVPAVNLFDEEDDLSSSGILYHRLQKLVLAGEVSRAEQLLFDEIDKYRQLPYFQTAMQFYQDLNEMSEAWLNARNFSKREIALGIRDVCKIFGIDPKDVQELMDDY